MDESLSPKVLAIIPVRERDVVSGGEMFLLAGKPFLSYTIEAAKDSKTISRVIVSTDGSRVAELAREFGAEVPFLRPVDLAGNEVPLVRVLQHCLGWLGREERYVPDVVVLLEVSHPVRPAGLINRVLETLLSQSLETVFAAVESRQEFWQMEEHGSLRRLDSEEASTRSERRPLYGQLSGLVCATRPETIRRGAIIGRNVGIVPVRGLLGHVDLQDEGGFELAEFLLGRQS